jgi:hypothetical protein
VNYLKLTGSRFIEAKNAIGIPIAGAIANTSALIVSGAVHASAAG